MSRRDAIENRSEYWFDPTAKEAIARVNHKVQAAIPQKRQKRGEIPKADILTSKPTNDIRAEYRGRKKVLQSLQERLLAASQEERGELLSQLYNLDAQQFAAKTEIRRRRR